MEELFSKIAKVNKEIKTINLKGKRYAPVNERIIAFRKVYPNGDIFTEIQFSENYIMATATAYGSDGTRLGVGHARELANKPFALENAETSAIGRCIGISTGLGVSTSLSSFEDMQNIDSPSGVFSDTPSKELIDRFNKLSNTQKANILNLCKTTDVKTIKADVLESLVANAK